MSFLFNETKRIGDDECSRDITAIQNSGTCSYYMQNYFVGDCTMKSAKAFATSQPGINFVGFDMCGTAVDANSKLLIGSLQTHPKCKLDLVQRPFATVPFLGRGSVNPAMEAQIQQGSRGSSRKTVTHLAEKSPMRHHTTPLIPSMKRNIQNAQAPEVWTRGGQASRELNRDSTMSKNMSMASL